MEFLLPFATTISTAIFRRWIGDNVGSDLFDAIASSARPNLSHALTKRRIERERDRVAETIAEKLSTYISVEFATIADNELQATLLGAQKTLSAAEIGAKQIVAADMEPSRLFRQLIDGDPDRARRAALSEPARQLYYLLVREASTYLVEMASLLPDFDTELAKTILAHESSVDNILHEMLDNLPRPPILGGNASENQAFRAEYMRAINRHLDHIELFGLQLSPRTARYNLSIAYISLSATIDGKQAGEQAQSRDEVSGVLQRNRRLLIRGQAGSGKTTLLRWVAVNVAQEKLGDDLNELRSTVPFYLPLRQFAGGDLPSPSDFLQSVARNIADLAPTGWATRVLTSGEGLILIDGIDELPEEQRSEAQEWIRTLTSDFPDCRFIVTSRPPALDEGWQELPGFAIADLEPMSPVQIDDFIDHWHRAAGGSDNGQEERDSVARQLKVAIRSTSSLRSLTTSPLLCAMLCALHLEQRAHLPRDRMEIYDVALGMLLDRRDRQRRVEGDLEPPLTRKQKQLILRSIAYWFVKNAYSDRPEDEVSRTIDTSLRSMTHVVASPKQILQHLLVRTGVIYRPAPDRISFVHKTFQEYLAAEEAVDQQDFAIMIDNAHRDQWREVVILACGHATRPQRERIIGDLLDRGTTDVDWQHSLHLLAVACLETSETLSSELRSRISAALAKLIPPATMAEASDVASAGDLAVPLLAPHYRSALDAAVPSARALAMIGTPSALIALEDFGADRGRKRVTLARELVRDWDYFDIDEYASRVLSDSILDWGRLHVESQEKVAASRNLRHLKRLHATLVRCDNLSAFELNTKLVELTVFDLPTATSLEFLVDASALCRLLVGMGPALERLDGIESMSHLLQLYVGGARALRSLRCVEQCSSLTTLTIDGATSLESVDVPFPSKLETLKLTTSRIPADLDRSLTAVPLRALEVKFADGSLVLKNANLQNVRSVTIDQSSMVPGERSDLSALKSASSLEHLEARGMRFGDDSLVPDDPVLVGVDLSGSEVGDRLGDLRGAANTLERLIIDELPGPVDVSVLADLPNLKGISGCSTLTPEQIVFLLEHTSANIYVDEKTGHDVRRGYLRTSGMGMRLNLVPNWVEVRLTEIGSEALFDAFAFSSKTRGMAFQHVR